METKEQLYIGSIGVLAISLIAMGINILPEDTHYSESLGITMHCERLSDTGHTCYPKSDTRKGSKYSETIWEPIIRNSVEPNDIDYECRRGYTCYNGIMVRQ